MTDSIIFSNRGEWRIQLPEKACLAENHNMYISSKLTNPEQTGSHFLDAGLVAGINI
jgi:hypothetical protein